MAYGDHDPGALAFVPAGTAGMAGWIGLMGAACMMALALLVCAR